MTWWSLANRPSFYLRIANDDSLMLHQEWVAECVSRGLFLASHHNHFLNAAITDEDIALAIDIANDAFSVVAARHPELELKKWLNCPQIRSTSEFEGSFSIKR